MPGQRILKPAQLYFTNVVQVTQVIKSSLGTSTRRLRYDEHLVSLVGWHDDCFSLYLTLSCHLDSEGVTLHIGDRTSCVMTEPATSGTAQLPAARAGGLEGHPGHIHGGIVIRAGPITQELHHHFLVA